MKTIQNYPLYSIGVVSELLGVHPETVRTWERFEVVQPPQRRSGKRSYSEKDLCRLQFIQKLVSEGLTIRAIRYYLRLYPCWKTTDCTGCANSSDQIAGAKPCWQEVQKLQTIHRRTPQGQAVLLLVWQHRSPPRIQARIGESQRHGPVQDSPAGVLSR